jgi:hypothetical protein
MLLAQQQVQVEGGLVNNGQLIAELVHNYREVQGVSETRGDYAFIGALYNEYGYSQVLSGINDLARPWR